MFVTHRIARRYLWATRKQAHTAFLSLISILGLAVGVATLLISLALLSGLQGQIKMRLISSSPHLLIEPLASNVIEEADAIAAAAGRLGMKRVHPQVSGIGWAANESTDRGRPIRIRTSTEPLEKTAIIVTRDAAAALGLDRGQTITLIGPRTRLTPFGPVPILRKYRIAGVVSSGSEEEAADAFLDLREAQEFFATRGKPTSIEMYGNVEAAESARGVLARQFPGVQVKTWKEINRPLFLALRLEKIVMFATISLIIFVAALNLISSLAMLIVEKRPAVGVLRTLGATERDILSLFLQVGLLIGITGTLIGNAVGLGVSWAANHYHLVRLPAEMYFISYLPFVLDAADVIGVNLIAIVLSVVAAWYPARVASRLDPITAIREE